MAQLIIDEVLHSKGLTRKNLADRLKIDPRKLDKKINGSITFNFMQEVASALFVNVCDLIYEYVDPISERHKTEIVLAYPTFGDVDINIEENKNIFSKEMDDAANLLSQASNILKESKYTRSGGYGNKYNYQNMENDKHRTIGIIDGISSSLSMLSYNIKKNK